MRFTVRVRTRVRALLDLSRRTARGQGLGNLGSRGPLNRDLIYSIVVVSRCCCYFGLVPRAKMLKMSAWLRHPGLVTRLHLPYAIVVRWLHVRKSNVVILTPETAGTVGV